MRIVELKPVSRDKIGRVNKNGIKIKIHEDVTALFLTQYGFNIEVIRPVNTPHSNNPDFLINGSIWEAKSPDGGGKSTVERNIRKAGHQAPNIIFDLRRIKLPREKAEQETMKEFSRSNRLRRMLLITKNEKLFDIRK